MIIVSNVKYCPDYAAASQPRRLLFAFLRALLAPGRLTRSLLCISDALPTPQCHGWLTFFLPCLVTGSAGQHHSTQHQICAMRGIMFAPHTHCAYLSVVCNGATTALPVLPPLPSATANKKTHLQARTSRRMPACKKVFFPLLSQPLARALIFTILWIIALT